MQYENRSLERHETVPQAEQLQVLGAAYRERYNERLEDFFSREEPNVPEFREIFWRYGVLDRLVPESQEEVLARRLLGRDVFEGGPHATALYWRILAACHQSRMGVADRSSWIMRPIEFTITKLLNTNPDLFDAFFGVGENRIDIDDWLIGCIEERARDTLIGLGVDDPRLPEVGARIECRGITTQIIGYTADGLAVLQAKDASLQQTLAQTQLPFSSAISPEEIR